MGRAESIQRSCALAVIPAVALALASTNGAQAATTVGAVAPEAERGPAAVAFSPGLSSPNLIPTAGVITSWSFNGGPGGDDSGEPVALKVFRTELVEPEGLIRATVIASSRPEFTPSGVHSFKTRIPVSRGESIGVYSSYTNPFYPAAGQTSCGSDSEGVLGEAYTATQNAECLPQTAVNVAAKIEADSDGDGFGDESQDRCRGLAGKAQGCPGTLTGKAQGGLKFEIRFGYRDDGSTLSSPPASLVVEHLTFEVKIRCNVVSDRFRFSALSKKHPIEVRKNGSFTVHLYGGSDSISAASYTDISGEVKGTKASGKIRARVYFRDRGLCRMPVRKWRARVR